MNTETIDALTIAVIDMTHLLNTCELPRLIPGISDNPVARELLRDLQTRVQGDPVAIECAVQGMALGLAMGRVLGALDSEALARVTVPDTLEGMGA